MLTCPAVAGGYAACTCVRSHQYTTCILYPTIGSVLVLPLTTLPIVVVMRYSPALRQPVYNGPGSGPSRTFFQ